MTLKLGRIDCVTSWRNVCVLGKELGLLFYASPPSVSLSVTFLKLFSYTCIVRSPRFIPSLFYTLSAVQVYTDRAKYPARIRLLHLRKCTKFVGTIILSPNNNYSLETLSATIKTEHEEMIVAVNAVYANKEAWKKNSGLFSGFFTQLHKLRIV